MFSLTKFYLILIRFGTSTRKDPKKDDVPGPGDTNVPHFTDNA